MKAFLFLIAVLVSGSALACSCGPIPPPLKALEQADAVFFAKVIKTEERDGPDNFNGRSEALIPRLAVTFEIQKKLKGDINTQNVIVFTGLGGGDCGYPFEDNKSYLIYAFKAQGSLTTDICTRTHETTLDSKEILELEHRLAPLKGEEKPPSLLLKGKIDDAGYSGYIFALKNTLKDRIFFLGHQNWLFVSQKLIDGKWVDSVPNFDVVAMKSDEAIDIQKNNVDHWKVDYNAIQAESYYAYLDAADSMPIFAASQSNKHTWRVGIQYVTEDNFYSGKKIQQSETIVWSQPISPDQKAAPLSFNEAFKQQKE